MSSTHRDSSRDLSELIFGYGLILLVLWVPERVQFILGPIALAATLLIVLARRKKVDEQDSSRDQALGLGRRGLIPSLWILPAALAFAALSVLVAKNLLTLHPLYQADALHVTGYVLWTLYQQFLLNDYFMPRLTRMLTNEVAAITVAALLFAVAHLPNLPLAAATLVWGALSCVLFRRYRNLYALGLAQGLLGLCFAVCIPEALSHHLQVGLGYLNYPN
jgi:membrane protease YdiL (CAAX protease family)